MTQTIAQTLGAKDGLAEHVSERELLLLLDNFEQVVEAAPSSRSCSRPAPTCGSWSPAGSCCGSAARSTTRCRHSPRRRRSSSSVERSHLEPDETIAELCRRLDELPLAVELAAARTHVLTPAQILDRLGQRLDLLKGGRDADPRQQTLRATIEWSHDLLTQDEQQLFARLAVFTGGSTLDAAEDVCDADLDVLQSLVDKSLLRHTGERFWMLETIREFAAERLKDREAASQIFERHARWFLGLATSAVGGFPRAEEGLVRLDAELENLRSVIGWARDHDGRVEVELVGAAWWFLFMRGLFREALNYLVHALETARSTSLDQAELLRGAGTVARVLGDLAATQQWIEELLELGRARGDARAIAGSLAILASVAVDRGDLERARTLLLDADDAARAYGDMNMLMLVAHVHGEIDLEAGHAQTARKHFQEALELARELRNARSESIALASLARVAFLDGDTDDAAACLDGSLRLVNALGERAGIFECLLGLAEVAVQRSELARAARLLGAADALREEIGYDPGPDGRKQHERVATALGEDAHWSKRNPKDVR